MRALALVALSCLTLACRTGGKAAGGEGLTEGDAAVDADGDGFTADEDCDDARADVFPEADERCDGVDNDCDGEIDGPDALDATDWYPDADADGYGDADGGARSCAAPAGWIADGTDCDDAEPTVWPGATELCDTLDNDCDGETDEGVTSTWYVDGDDDGFGDAPVEACSQPSGTAAVDGDCDDTTAAVFPGNPEVCDELDNDCDDQVDEDVTTTFYADGDGDGFGDAAATSEACFVPEGYAETGDDCDDGDDAIHPDAAEVCNGVDDDCDGRTDADDADVVDASTWYDDADSDGYGDPSSALLACAQPAGFVADDTDCDDGNDAIHPGAAEVCNGDDDDCDGLTDDDDPSVTGRTTWYDDLDSDGYGDAAAGTAACVQPSGTVTDDTDCDDADPLANPGQSELYDGVDNDCDGSADEDLYRGTGGDGPLTVTGTTDLSTDANSGRSAADAVAFGVTAISGDTLTLDATASGLAAGDEVLLIHLQGDAGAYAAVGTYEFATIGSTSGATVTLLQSVAETYGETSNSDLSGQTIVLQRVPHYTDVSVAAGATLTTAAWDGSRGGVLAFRATGTVSVASGGLISVSELGYAGGETGTNFNDDAYQGESLAGLGDGGYAGGPYNEANGAYAANLGGGGANVTGGGGNHAGGATDGESWNGGGYTAPAAGSTYGVADLSTLFFGSGGGGVWNGGTNAVGEDPGPGGDGGGIVLIGAALVQLDGAAALTADGGSTSHWAQGTWTYGAAGGAGGSIFIVADEVDLAADSVLAEGGLGQASYIRAGGDGGDGRIRIDCSTCNSASQGSSAADSQLAAACAPDPGENQVP